MQGSLSDAFPKSVEGVWEEISTDVPSWKKNIGRKISIERNNNKYEVKFFGEEQSKLRIYTGNDTRIVRTKLEYLSAPIEKWNKVRESLKQTTPNFQVPINETLTLSDDGNFIIWARDARLIYADNNGRYSGYEISPGHYTATLKRISGKVKTEATE